ncbi:MotA/TolQ/ExbB proton channel family protein [Thalassoroseus pseudoceratinae]|uniref:MotA/TolQ/ExbB proton channel family protein n=1 Tax=Thalassoroseus pseudoceratinae TaxID=2713176 RepID=UPI001F0D28D9|nr:MotA/TolQ/ExbB proton channel family protein [Thalassoroseus pseudoceratinae]
MSRISNAGATLSVSWSMLLCGALACGAFTATAFTPAAVYAQEEEEAADDGADAGGEEAADDAPAPKESFLSYAIRASGFFGLLLLILSFIMVALIMMNTLQVRRDNLMPAGFIDDFEQRLTQKDYQGAYETAKADDSFIARVLAAGLSKLNRGYEEAAEGMQEVGEEENMALEHRLSYLALIGTIAPMLGLMGTVYGMIQSFQTIATSKTSPKPSELAGGISTALFTTIEGLAVAIPAMVFYSLLRNRVQRLVLEVGMVSEGLMSRFSTVNKKPAAGAAAPAAAPAAPQE